MRMENMLTYVKDQLATCQAAPPAATPTAPLPLTKYCQNNEMKIIQIPDPSTFHASKKDEILYKNWHLQMLNKMSANESTMLTETLNLAYI